MNPGKNPITTLLFDWDGTLFDSARAGFLAFQKTFDDLGIAFTEEFYETRYSPNWYAMYEALNLPKHKWKTETGRRCGPDNPRPLFARLSPRNRHQRHRAKSDSRD